jgi:sodium-dependent phosphate transporter
MVLSDYTYVFAIGTMFALLEAFNNGASMSWNPLLLGISHYRRFFARCWALTRTQKLITICSYR